jgi:hypothetical protein
VESVEPDAANDRTRVTLRGAETAPPGLPGGKPAGTLPPGALAFDEANVRAYILNARWTESEMQTLLARTGWDAGEVAAYAAELLSEAPSPPTAFYALREQAGFFGNNAPFYKSLSRGEKMTDNPFPHDWDSRAWDIWTSSLTNASYKVEAEDPDVYLDRTVSGVQPGGYAVFRQAPGGYAGPPTKTAIATARQDAILEKRSRAPAPPGATGSASTIDKPLPSIVVYQVAASEDTSINGFGLSNRVTALRLLQENGQALAGKPANFSVRGATAYLFSEPIALAPEPISGAIAAGATEITLDGLAIGLLTGQQLAITGEQAGTPGVTRREIVSVDSVYHDGGFTTVKLASALVYGYERTSMRLNANVARATHGETTQEVLGSGDGSQANQRFVLKKPPLTYVSSSTPSGSAGTLELRVDGVRWSEAPSLYGLDERSESYIVRLDDEARAAVIFGDGLSGARLPTGRENVTAIYRTGIGPDGEVPANAITLLQTRPLGVRSVANPLPSSGAAAPEQLEDARANAPFAVLTLDRVVSLRDYEDFARAFAGIGKARAVVLAAPGSRLVHITVGSATGKPVDETSDLYKNLVDAIEQSSDRTEPFVVQSYRPVFFKIEASVLVDDRYLVADVFAKVRETLQAAFSFAKRGFAQPVTAAEVTAIMQSVSGVVAVDLDHLYKLTGTASDAAKGFGEILIAEPATSTAGAELLLLASDGVTLAEMEQ